MRQGTLLVEDIEIPVHHYDTVIVGSGAAGLNAADTLFTLGNQAIAIITEGMNMGTSRNTGSDKQTYYKLSLSGSTPDSVDEMAKTLFNGGAMQGDIALVEAAMSANCFYKLVHIGVPFPHNTYGEYVGYKTDHDPRQRATSAGPLTSRFITEKLEEQVKKNKTPIFDGFQVIALLTEPLDRADGSAQSLENQVDRKKIAGLLAIDLTKARTEKNALISFTLFHCSHIIYATGGPADIYKTSVYPLCQTGSTGIALEAGAKGVNLTESQYGIASIQFRWNLSGTYQQVLPRYVSTDQNGADEKEFLQEYFSNWGKMQDAIFLKGYQWPFDPKKIVDEGSSLIDILVFHETELKGRRVFLDFTKNSVNHAQTHSGDEACGFDFSRLAEESYTYLEKSGALFGTPIERLRKMNPAAIELYRAHGIFLEKEYLEVAICAQHNNGGLVGDAWWESNIQGLFPVGEVNGTFGVYRPGGSALNSTQVGSTRAAQSIAARHKPKNDDSDKFIKAVFNQVKEKIYFAKSLLKAKDEKPIDQQTCNNSPVVHFLHKIQSRMTECGAHIRSLSAIEDALLSCREDIVNFSTENQIRHGSELSRAFQNWNSLITQLVYLSSIREYILYGGLSRGSYLILDENGVLPVKGLPERFRFRIGEDPLKDIVCESELIFNGQNYTVMHVWKKVTPIPDREQWFENVWEAYRTGDIFNT